MAFQQWADRVRLRVRSLWRRAQVDRELDDELKAHLEMRIEAEVAEGKPVEQARAEALREMGGIEQRKEECRDARRVRWLQDIVQDLSYAVRTLLKTPAFTVVAMAVLGVGIGANTAVFTVVNRVLLEPLPYAQPNRLYLVSVAPKHLMFNPGPMMVDRQYLEFRAHNHSFESLASLGSAAGRKMTLTGHGEPVVLTASMVGPDFLRVLRVNPELGRPFLSDGQADENVVLLSHRMWASRFGSDRKILGQGITLDGVSYSVVGIMPATFAFQNADLWLRDPMRLEAHNVFFIPVVGRLRPGVSAQQAQAELATFAANLPKDGGFSREGYEARVLPLKELFVAGVRKQLLIFSGAVAFVFLIACANFANLLLIRGAGRQPELAVRAALGASRWRLVRQLLTESTLISAAGAGLGLLFSVVGVRVIAALLLAENAVKGERFGLSLGVLGFTVGLALLTGLVFGLAPALQATRRELREGVNEGGRNVVTRRERLRGALVISEVALALVLLTGAGLLVKSFLRMRAVNPGFRAEGISVATIDLPGARYKTTEQLKEFDDRVLAALQVLPGAKSVAAVSFLPFGAGVMGDFQIEAGRHLPDGFTVDKPVVSADYFRAMEIPVMRGRGFTEHDTLGAPGVLVISESVARKLWPAGNAVGQRISMDDHPKAGDWLTIVGVVGDVRQQGLNDRLGAVVYQPYAQIRMPGFILRMSFVVRSANTEAMTAAMRAVIRQTDGDLPTDSVTTMTNILSEATLGTQLQARLLGMFAVVALVIAAIGIYGVLAYSVAERLHEFGIRIALGAQQRDILWMILHKTLLLTGAGVVLGMMGGLAVTSVLRQFLFEVTPGDPETFIIVSAVLMAVAIASAWVPVKKAVSVDAQVVLRCE